ncbi:MAG: diaminopimelate epimerase [Flavobacteriia bacterium]|jgi:diaminopimelate epimerase
MKVKFSKYQGTGNDFIMLDNLSGKYDSLTIPQIQYLCDRKFGIGADGLIKISKAENALFEVDYYNSDGSKSFCGNGARCSVAFAQKLGIDSNHVVFTAIDGLHEAQKKDDLVSLKMNNVHDIKEIGSDYELHTGSPHYIRFVENSLDLNVFQEGRKVRYAPSYQEEGINVNFVEELNPSELEVATYERGVEDETLSCGTGVTAAALAYAQMKALFGKQEIKIHTKGGKLKIAFERTGDDDYVNIFLIGPAIHVFDGEIDIK